MRRQRQKRTARRRGLHHIGDVLSAIITDLDQEEFRESRPAAQKEHNVVPMPVVGCEPQSTFAFYQPVEV